MLIPSFGPACVYVDTFLLQYQMGLGGKNRSVTVPMWIKVSVDIWQTERQTGQNELMACVIWPLIFGSVTYPSVMRIAANYKTTVFW